MKSSSAASSHGTVFTVKKKKKIEGYAVAHYHGNWRCGTCCLSSSSLMIILLCLLCTALQLKVHVDKFGYQVAPTSSAVGLATHVVDRREKM